MFRLRDYTGFSRIDAADGYSAELLSIAETVLDGSDYSDAFMEAIVAGRRIIAPPPRR